MKEALKDKLELDKREKMNEQLKPPGEEKHEKLEQGLGQEMAMGDEEQDGIDAGSGGASGAPAPGVRSKANKEAEAEE